MKSHDAQEDHLRVLLQQLSELGTARAKSNSMSAATTARFIDIVNVGRRPHHSR